MNALKRPKRPNRYHPLPKGAYRVSTWARYSNGNPHWAIDYAANFGTPVRAPVDSVVHLVRDGEPDFLGMKPGRPGNVVVLRWTTKDGRRRAVFFNHLRNGSVRVKQGQTVKAGQVVGEVGSSGNSSGPHLHAATLTYWPDWWNLYQYMNSPEWRVWPANRPWRGPLARFRERLEAYRNMRRERRREAARTA